MGEKSGKDSSNCLMRILHLITTLDLGGAERHLYYLVREMIKKGYRIDVAYLKGQGKMGGLFQELGVRVFPLNMHTVFAPRGILRLYRLIRENRYLLIHTHLFKADFLGGIVGKLAGCPRIISTKHNIDLYLKKPLLKFVGRAIACLNYRIVAISRAVRDFLLDTGFPPEKIEVIYYGIERPQVSGEKSFPWGDGRTKIICVARLYPQKGHIYLIEALKKLKNTCPHFLCLFVGDGPLRDFLKKKVKDKGLEKEIRFLGWREDVPELISQSDFLVLPSLWEGFGLVLLEAMLLGKPVVATRVGPIPEVVEDGVTGLLVPPRDVDGLVEKMKELLNSPTLREKMGKKGEERACSLFSLEKMAQQYDRLYKKASRKEVVKIFRPTIGGAARHIKYLIKTLSPDYNFTLLFPAERNPSFLSDASLSIRNLPLSREISFLEDGLNFLRILCYLFTNPCDILHLHCAKAGFLGGLAGRIARIKKIIYTPHNFYFVYLSPGWRRKIYLFLEKLNCSFAHTLFLVSPAEVHRAKRDLHIAPARIFYLPNAIDPEEFQEKKICFPENLEKIRERKGFKVVSIGRWEFPKDPWTVIETANILREKDFLFILVGGGEEKERLEEEVGRKNLDKVFLFPYQEDIKPFLFLADCILSSSLSEGFPYILLEAWASGKPLVLSDIPEHQMIVREGETALLFRKRDPQDLSRVLEKLESDPPLRKKLIENGRKEVEEKYNLKKWKKEIKKLYD